MSIVTSPFQYRTLEGVIRSPKPPVPKRTSPACARPLERDGILPCPRSSFVVFLLHDLAKVKASRDGSC